MCGIKPSFPLKVPSHQSSEARLYRARMSPFRNDNSRLERPLYSYLAMASYKSSVASVIHKIRMKKRKAFGQQLIKYQPSSLTLDGADVLCCSSDNLSPSSSLETDDSAITEDADSLPTNSSEAISFSYFGPSKESGNMSSWYMMIVCKKHTVNIFVHNFVATGSLRSIKCYCEIIKSGYSSV